MLDGVHASSDRIFYCGRPVCVRAADFASSMGLIGGGSHLFDSELWRTNFTSRAEDAATCDQFDVVGTQLDLSSGCAAHRVWPISFVPQLPTMPARHANNYATQHKTRCWA